PPRVRDLGSANGTRVGARLLRRHEEVALERGDVVEIGSAVVLVQAAREQGHDFAASDCAPTPMEQVHKLVELVAPSTLSVILLGETGVGKDVLAQVIHTRSTRATRPFARVNVAALAESLLDSELFGHEKGAFTGATASKTGLIESADGGTLFLD